LRIQMLDLITSQRDQKIETRYFFILAHYLQKLGCKVDYLYKEDLFKIYFRYLKFKPDILISVSEEGPLPTLLKKLGLVHAPHLHCWTDDYTDIDSQEYGISFIAFCEYYTVANADFIITPSVYRKERCDLWGKRAFYIPHGVDTNFDVMPEKLDGKTPVVYIGEQSARKKVDQLIKACGGVDCSLYLFGETNESYRSTAPPNVHFMGYLHPSKLPGYLKAAEVLALTPDDDCTLKMFEYIKAGKAILATRGKTGYFLTHLENAYLTDDFSEGLAELIDHPELRDSLAKNVKKIKVFTWEEIARMWLESMQQAMEEYHGPDWRNRRRKVGPTSLKSFISGAL
jgi:glycosyltransferase involved in cell wall biosynthesis